MAALGLCLGRHACHRLPPLGVQTLLAECPNVSPAVPAVPAMYAVPAVQDPSLRYAFRVVSPDKEYVLQAENEVEQQEWMQMLQVGGIVL